MMANDLHDRLELATNIAKLTGYALDEVLTLIRQEQPRALQFNDHNWVFDTAHLENFVVLKLKKLVNRHLAAEEAVTLPPLQRENTDHLPQDDNGSEEVVLEQSFGSRFGKDPSMEAPEDIKSSDTIFPGNTERSTGKRMLAPDTENSAATGGLKKPRINPESAPVNQTNQPLSTKSVGSRTRSPSSSQALDTSGMVVSEVISDIKVFSNPDTTSNLRLICGKCNKLFRKRTEIVTHIRTHTGEKPLKCQFCNLRYAHPSNLRSHERKHANGLPFRCEHPSCSRAFSKSNELKAHIREKHPQMCNQRCSICQKLYKSKANLDSHMQSAHPEAVKIASKKQHRSTRA